MSEEITDNPTGWINRHIRQYVESNGAKGHIWRGLPTLLLTTRGRRTGVLRRTALIYGTSGEDHVVVASNGGSDGHPAWYLNLAASPSVEVQVGGSVFNATARTATGDERAALWSIMAAIFPTYESYRKKAAREIPVVVLSRV